MSWGDHDVDLINKKLGVESRIKQKEADKVSMDTQLFLKHKANNDDNNLCYRDRDWFQVGLEEGRKITKNYGYVNNFSKNLKIIRIATGFTMEELHNQCGISIQTIGKYESGDTEPTISKLIKLAEGLSVSLPYLVGADLSLSIKEL